MTLKSFPNNDEEMAATASTSAPPSTDGSMASRDLSDAFPIPFFDGGRKEVVMHTDEGKMVAELPGDMFSNTNVNIKVKDSPMTEIGNQVKIVADAVTINNFPNPNSPAIQNFREKIECTGNAWKAPISLILIALGLLTCIFLFSEPFLSTTAFTEPLANDSAIRELFITRTMWGGSKARNVTPANAATLVVVKHTGGKTCSDFKSCSKRVRDLQKEQMGKGLVDIEYNFLVGGDGRIYVGRGWYVQNEGILDTVDIAFIGNFTENVPTEKMIGASEQLIAQGSASSALVFSEYYVVCHNQTEMTDSPGANLFAEVTRWMYYYPGSVIPEDA